MIHTDINLNNNEFEQLCSLVYRITGIHLNDSKRDLVHNRFTKRMRALNIHNFSDYLNYVNNNEAVESEHFSNAITTNLTSFYREAHHFEILENTVIPKLLKKNNRRIRIWSAGCSTGEEAYSIALTLLSKIPNIARWDVKILATDLDSNVLETAAAGIYSIDRIKNISDPNILKWFQKNTSESEITQVRVHPKARSLISFKLLNLMNDWPMKGPFDVIFCRNVVIYFDKPTQEVLFEKLSSLQSIGDHLFVGHSENISKVTNEYKHMGKTVYIKK